MRANTNVAGETVRDGARNGAYLGGRFVLGVADVGENAYVGVQSNIELLAEDEEAAVKTAQTHAVDDAANAWGDFMEADEQIREIGDYVETGGEIATEVALGAVAVTASAPAALAAGAVLVLDEMGKSLKPALKTVRYLRRISSEKSLRNCYGSNASCRTRSK